MMTRSSSLRGFWRKGIAPDEGGDLLISIIEADSFGCSTLWIWGRVMALTLAARLVVEFAVSFARPCGWREESCEFGSSRSSTHDLDQYPLLGIVGRYERKMIVELTVVKKVLVGVVVSVGGRSVILTSMVRY
jgi:hypothetical protein